jgi:hypothetical protein
VPGDVLPSVSRRNPLHARADVWTASNRVFACRAPAAAATVARALIAAREVEADVAESLGRPLAGEERGAVAIAAGQLARLLDIERHEPTSSGRA